MEKTISKRRPGRKPLPKETLQAMKKLLKEGNPYRVVADKVGLSIPTVGRYCRAWGL